MFDKRVARLVVPVEPKSVNCEKMWSNGDLPRFVFVASLEHVVVDDNVKSKVVVGGLGKNDELDVQVPPWGPGLHVLVHARPRLFIRDSGSKCVRDLVSDNLPSSMRAAAMQFHSSWVQGLAQLFDRLKPYVYQNPPSPF